MLVKTPSDVISESKKLLFCCQTSFSTAGDIFNSFIRQSNSRNFLIAISDSIEFRHDNARSRGLAAVNLEHKKIFLKNQDWQSSSLNSKVGRRVKSSAPYNSVSRQAHLQNLK